MVEIDRASADEPRQATVRRLGVVPFDSLVVKRES
jgi:hypothetical protein